MAMKMDTSLEEVIEIDELVMIHITMRVGFLPEVEFCKPKYSTEDIERLVIACDVAMSFLESEDAALEDADAVWSQLKAAVDRVKEDEESRE